MNTIFYVDIQLGMEVYAAPLGFTTQLDKFVYSESSEIANLVAQKWFEAKGIPVVKTRARPAVCQDIQGYTFLEQILNLPQEVADAEFQRRNYPESFRSTVQSVKLS